MSNGRVHASKSGCFALAALVLMLGTARSQEPPGKVAEKASPAIAVRLHRSAEIIKGREDEARQFARQMIDYLSKHHPEVTVRAFIDESGDTSVMHGFVDAKDLETLQQTRAKYFSSGEFLKLFATARGILVESTAREALLVEVK